MAELPACTYVLQTCFLDCKKWYKNTLYNIKHPGFQKITTHNYILVFVFNLDNLDPGKPVPELDDKA
jgi:hypothetical protein